MLANIKEAIDEGSGPNFEMLDGFEELRADAQEKVKKAIETGEIDDADKTVVSYVIIHDTYEDWLLISFSNRPRVKLLAR